MLNKFIYLTILFFLFLSAHGGYALNKKTLAFKNNWDKVHLVYYDKFPYNMGGEDKEIPECTKFPADEQQKNKAFLLCKEHIILLRPAAVIHLWRRQQRRKGYISLSMKEFGIINVHAYIASVNKYVPTIKNNITTDMKKVTGKFIRYTSAVNHYMIKNNKTHTITVVNATPNHPFYVINRHKFIPISKVLPFDSLMTLSNQPCSLVYPGSDNLLPGAIRKKNTLTRVYNIEIEKKHVYFVSKINILVHNPCEHLVAYYKHLKSYDIIQKCHVGNEPGLRLYLPAADVKFLDVTMELNSVLAPHGGINSGILEKIHALGFGFMENYGLSSLAEEERVNVRELLRTPSLLTWKLLKPMPMPDYEANFLPYVKDIEQACQDMEVSSTSKETSGLLGMDSDECSSIDIDDNYNHHADYSERNYRSLEHEAMQLPDGNELLLGIQELRSAGLSNEHIRVALFKRIH